MRELTKRSADAGSKRIVVFGDSLAVAGLISGLKKDCRAAVLLLNMDMFVHAPNSLSISARTCAAEIVRPASISVMPF